MEATNEEVMNATEALTAVLKEVVALKVDSTSMAVVKENLASIKEDIKLIQSNMARNNSPEKMQESITAAMEEGVPGLDTDINISKKVRHIWI